jgi:hypothetical protein
VSDLPKENAKVDELTRHVYYTAKVIRKLTLSEAKSSVPFSSTGSYIDEQSHIGIFNIKEDVVWNIRTIPYSTKCLATLF